MPVFSSHPICAPVYILHQRGNGCTRRGHTEGNARSPRSFLMLQRKKRLDKNKKIMQYGVMMSYVFRYKKTESSRAVLTFIMTYFPSSCFINSSAIMWMMPHMLLALSAIWMMTQTMYGVCHVTVTPEQTTVQKSVTAAHKHSSKSLDCHAVLREPARTSVCSSSLRHDIWHRSRSHSTSNNYSAV